MKQVESRALMEAMFSSETSVAFQRTIWHSIPEDRTLHDCCENLRSYTEPQFVTKKGWISVPNFKSQVTCNYNTCSYNCTTIFWCLSMYDSHPTYQTGKDTDKHLRKVKLSRTVDLVSFQLLRWVKDAS